MRSAIAIIATLLVTAAAQAAPPQAAGCADCHGKDGVSAGGEVPTIAGISAFALEEQLQGYKAKARPCEKHKFAAGDHPAGATDDMCTIAGKLGDADITALAAHFAALKFAPAKNAVDAAKAAAGKKVHTTNCEKCHSNGGSLADDDASILAGQPKGYLVEAFKELRAGQREMDEKMAPKMKALKDADVEALIEFYAGGGK
jgi:cytochrome c553